jgi:hypothetical protein
MKKTFFKPYALFFLMTFCILIVFGSCGSGQDLSTPEATVKTLIAASEAKDKDNLSACFSKNAAGEFQSIVNKTLTDKQLNELKIFFTGAIITSSHLEGNNAVVSLKLNSREENIALAKEGEQWLILDF